MGHDHSPAEATRMGHDYASGDATHMGHDHAPGDATHVGHDYAPGDATAATHEDAGDDAAHMGRFHASGDQNRAGRGAVAALVPANAKVGRLTHQLPPATRRKVKESHGNRCAVPHCGLGKWVDLHHIRPRHQGGRHEAANLVLIRSLHHRLIHSNQLLAARTAEGIRFFLPDGTPFGKSQRSHDIQPETEFASAVLGLLDAEPLFGSQIETALGLTEAHGARLLSMLRARGEVFERPAGDWARVDRILPGAPMWVTHATTESAAA